MGIETLYDAKQVPLNRIFNKLGFLLPRLYPQDYSLFNVSLDCHMKPSINASPGISNQSSNY